MCVIMNDESVQLYQFTSVTHSVWSPSISVFASSLRIFALSDKMFLLSCSHVVGIILYGVCISPCNWPMVCGCTVER